jgi:hypothetical protein
MLSTGCEFYGEFSRFVDGDSLMVLKSLKVLKALTVLKALEKNRNRNAEIAEHAEMGGEDQGSKNWTSDVMETHEREDTLKVLKLLTVLKRGGEFEITDTGG